MDSLKLYTQFDLPSDYNVTLTGVEPNCSIQRKLMEKAISWKNESGTVEAKYIPMALDCKTFSQFNESILPHVQQPVKSIDITPFIRVSLFVKFLCRPGLPYVVQNGTRGHQGGGLWGTTPMALMLRLPAMKLHAQRSLGMLIPSHDNSDAVAVTNSRPPLIRVGSRWGPGFFYRAMVARLLGLPRGFFIVYCQRVVVPRGMINEL